jgi:hypothetical protein
MEQDNRRDARLRDLGEHVRVSRESAGYPTITSFVGPSRSVRSISAIELGDPVGDKVQRSVESALGWPSGSIAKYVAGGPLPKPYGRRHDDHPQVDVVTDPVRARIAAMTNRELLERAAEIELTAGKECADAYVESAWEIRRRAPKQPLTTNQT